MNELIRALWDQAAEINQQRQDSNSGSWESEVEFMNLFAELIIAECVSVPYSMWDRAELNADVAVKIDRRIKDHFGMEDEE